jgi:phytoene dehydrogenase-like protein
MADYDAIVCGGGSNGLAAAIRLAEKGWSVCLLEANEDLGGAARTLESTLPGFKHDFGAAFFPLVAPSPSIIGRDLAPWGLRFVHAQVPAAHPFPGNQAIALGRSAVETAASIDKVHLGDGSAWFALDEAFGPVMKPFLRAQMQRWPFEELVKVVGRLRLSGGIQFARMVVSGVSAIADRFESDQARAFLTGPAMHADLPPEAPGTGIYALLLSMLGQRHGMPVVEGGTGMITAALEAKARGDGVEIFTGRRVGRIVVEGGRAVAVEAGGDPVSARRAVICALEVGDLVRLAGPESFPPKALAEIRHYRPGLGTFKVDWALDGPVPWAAEECRRAAVVHVGDSVTDMSRSAWEAGHGLLPGKPTLILGQQSLADPSRAPAGKHTLWGYAHVPADPTGDAARPRAKGGWDRSAGPFLERMEAGI